MALSITNRGSGNHNTGAASFTLSPASNCAAGSTVVLCVAADNSSSAGTTNDFTTVTDTLGNTWTKRQSPVFDNGAASAGVQGAIYTTGQNGGAIQTGTVITVNFGSSPVAKTWTLTEIVPAAGKTADFRTGGDKSAGATSSAMTMGASASVNVGEVIVAAFFIEGGTTNSISTPDGDTTNGSWTTNQYAEIGSTTSGSCIVSQAKLQTTTASTQSYDVTAAVSNDYTGSYVILKETTTHTTALVADGGGTADIAASTRATTTALTADGASSIIVGTPAWATSTALTADGGGGIVVSAPTRATTTALVASGGSTADIAGATRETSTSLAANGVSDISIAGATISSGGAQHTTSLAADGGGAIVVSAPTRGTSTSIAADAGAGAVVGAPVRQTFAMLAATVAANAAISAPTRQTFSVIAADGSSSIVVSAPRLATFTALTASGVGNIETDATVSGAAVEYFASCDADGLGGIRVGATDKTRPEPRQRSHARTFAAFTRSGTFARLRRRR